MKCQSNLSKIKITFKLIISSVEIRVNVCFTLQTLKKKQTNGKAFYVFMNVSDGLAIMALTILYNAVEAYEVCYGKLLRLSFI